MTLLQFCLPASLVSAPTGSNLTGLPKKRLVWWCFMHYFKVKHFLLKNPLTGQPVLILLRRGARNWLLRRGARNWWFGIWNWSWFSCNIVKIHQHSVYNIVYRYCTLGWSDLALFENGHFPADQVYFYELNSKKSANLAARTWQSFHFISITGTLKMYIFMNICI